MKVVCINNNVSIIDNGPVNLTINKVYQLVDEDNFGYHIVNDDGRSYFYMKYYFKRLRDINIEILLNKC